MAKATSVEDELKQKLATKQAELKALQKLEDSHVAHIEKVYAKSQYNDPYVVITLYLSPLATA